MPAKTGADKLQVFREFVQGQFQATGQAVVKVPLDDYGPRSRGQRTRWRLKKIAAELGYRVETRIYGDVMAAFVSNPEESGIEVEPDRDSEWRDCSDCGMLGIINPATGRHEAGDGIMNEIHTFGCPALLKVQSAS